MKKAIMLFLMLIIAGSEVFSQTVTVIDKTNLQPVEGAKIESYSSRKISATTNADGTADISALRNEPVIYVSAEGFQSIFTSFPDIEAANYIIGLTEKSYTTDEIIVSTTKFGRDQAFQPQQVEILSSNEIDFRNQPTTAELLMSTGITLVQKSQLGGGSPVLRGFEASRVLITIDGVRLNNAIFRAGHLQNVLRIDESILDRVEILFGPGSVVYGSDALGGSMNFFTRKPQLSLNNETLFKTNAYGRFGSAMEEKTGHLDLNIGAKNIGFLGSITFSDFSSLRQGKHTDPFMPNLWDREFYQGRINNRDTMLLNDNVNVQKNSGYHQYDILGKVLIKQSPVVEHTFNFQYSNTNDIPRYDRLSEVNSSGAFTTAEWYYGPEKRLLGAYNLSLNSPNSLFNNASFTLAYQDIRESRHSRNWNNPFRTDRIENVKVYSGNFDFNKVVNNHLLSYGIEGDYNNVDSKASKINVNTDSLAPASTRYPSDGSNMYNFAAYILDNIKVSPIFALTGGVRFSYVALNANFLDTTFFKFPFTKAEQRNAAVTGNLGFVVTPKDSWRIALLGSTGFRAPNIDDLAKIFDTQPGVAVMVPNPDLKPEYLYSGELTVSKIFNDRIRIGGTAYYNYITNLIVTDNFTFNGQDSIIYDGVLTRVIASQNKDKGFVWGYNLNVDADITDWFSFNSTVSFTYGRVITDSVNVPLDHIPPVFGRTGITLNFDKFRGNVYALYNGWKHVWDYSPSGEDNIVYATPEGMPSWFTLNIKAAYQVVKNLSIEAGWENIFDKRYRVFGSGISSPGSNLVFTLRASY